MIYLITNQPDLYTTGAYKYISTTEAIRSLIKLKEISLDTETAGLDWFTKELLLLQLGDFEDQFLFDIASFNGKIPKELVLFMNEYPNLWILQNAKFDLHFLMLQGVILTKVYDTMLAEIIITNGLQFKGRGLASLAEKYCGAILNKSVRGQIIKQGLNDAVLVYGAKDIEYLPIIKRKQLAEAKALDLIQAINLDNAFVVVLAYIEYCGIKIDYEKWKKKTDVEVENVRQLKIALEQKLWEDRKYEYFSGMVDLFTGAQDCIINWNSPKQILTLLKSYEINTTIKIKGENKESIDAKVLLPQINDFDIIKPYLAYKAASKSVSTYGYNWKNYINKKTGRIHTTFYQLKDTGRMSSGNIRENKPNLQNLPSDSLTRSCFISEVDNLIISADYSSQEQILLANFSKEENLIQFYQRGFTDMHSYVAFLMYPDIRRCKVEELTPSSLTYIKKEYSENRKIAKNAGFAMKNFI